MRARDRAVKPHWEAKSRVRMAPPFYNGGWYNQWLLYEQNVDKKKHTNEHSIVVLRGGWNMQIPCIVISMRWIWFMFVSVYNIENASSHINWKISTLEKMANVLTTQKWIICWLCVRDVEHIQIVWISVLSVIVITSWLDEIVFTITECVYGVVVCL